MKNALHFSVVVRAVSEKNYDQKFQIFPNFLLWWSIFFKNMILTGLRYKSNFWILQFLDNGECKKN